MKPDWDTLMAEYKDNDKVFVGDVDCTAAGKPLCDSNGVQGFPTIKHGDPADLQDYKGGRDLKSLQAFTKTLKPMCSVANIDLCDDDEKAKIVKVQAMSAEDLDTAIAASDKKVKDAETLFDTELEKLQATYKGLGAAKEATLAEVKESGIGLYKSVRAAMKAADTAEPVKEEL
jgi:hypothetical protein